MQILKTERLELNTFREDYISDFIVYRNNMDWMKYQGFKGLSKQDYINRLIVPFDMHKGVQLAVVLIESNTLVGDVYVKVHNKTIDIGYTINPLYSKQGYTYEMVNAVIKYLESKYPNYIVEADSSIKNVASIKLLLKLGFVETHRDKDSCFFKYMRGEK